MSTGKSHNTTTALFIVDALDAVTDGAVAIAAGKLVEPLSRVGPDVRVA